MKIFIFEYLNRVSDNYHSEGGLAIIARDTYQAEELIKANKDIVIEKDEWADVIVYDLGGKIEPRIFIFPDAGCC